MLFPQFGSNIKLAWDKIQKINISQIYTLLFAIAGIVISLKISHTIQKYSITSGLKDNIINDILRYLFYIVILFSAYHQYIIYQGFHILEKEEKDWKNKTHGWVGSRLEKILRLFIIIIVLGAFSKGDSVISLLDFFPEKKVLIIAWVQKMNFELSNKELIYLILITVTFLLFMVWSIFGMITIYIKKGKDKKLFKNPIVKKLGLWCLSDFIAFLTWFSIVVLLWTHQYSFLNSFVSIFAFIYIVLIGLRLIYDRKKK
ncbi:MAG: hypothetical protein L6Q77_14880 [Bacteroidetes bacterium]|nr:hypothetical protein [Bacteroidota bacterium]